MIWTPERRARHAEAMKRLWDDPKFRAAASERGRRTMQKLQKDKAFCLRRDATARELLNRARRDRKFEEARRTALARALRSKAYRQKKSLEMRERYRNEAYCHANRAQLAKIRAAPGYREQNLDQIRSLNINPECVRKLRKARALLWRDPKSRSDQAERLERLRRDPDFEAKRVEGLHRALADRDGGDARVRSSIAEKTRLKAQDVDDLFSKFQPEKSDE